MSVPRIYSVYSYDRQVFDYYEALGAGGTHAGAPPNRGRGSIGAIPEQSSWRVPMGARKIGSGDLPRGKIASFDSSIAGMGGIPGGNMGLGIAAVLAYFAWKALR